MNKQIQIRNAVLEDVSALCELLNLLFAQEADFSPNPTLQANALQLIIQQPTTGQIICAIENGKVIGMVNILFTISTAEGGLAAWLEDMIVHPDCRGRGIGDKLLKEGIRTAQSAGCSRITLLTDDANVFAQQFYKRAGFVPSKMIPLRLHLFKTEAGSIS
jgi:ribosomal protein S18 acetylase RimI-like enzyme